MEAPLKGCGMNLLKTTTLGLALVATLFAATSAGAAPVELALSIDGSGSISAGNFTLQKGAYANVLSQAAGILPADGTVAIGVWQFSTTVQQVFALQVINDETDRANLIAAINGMTQLGDLTNLAGAISTPAAALAALDHANDNELIDVSTDGTPTTGGDPIAARNAALAGGVERINGLGIGAGADLSFAGGPGSFTMTVANFADFEAALRLKITREIDGIPEPGTIALLGLGLVGIGGYAVRRRRRAA
jgi:hypothetical protein